MYKKNIPSHISNEEEFFMKNIKKILFMFLGFVLIFTTACDNVGNTPTKKVEELMGKYQSVDDDVLDDLNNVIANEENLTIEQQDRYRKLIEKQYKNLTYEIKEEKVDGDNATVEVEIQVIDLAKANNEAEEYLANNRDEFNDDTGDYSQEKFTNYKLDKMEDSKDKVTYTLQLTLTKEDDEWELDNLTETERQKIHGIYNY